MSQTIVAQLKEDNNELKDAIKSFNEGTLNPQSLNSKTAAYGRKAALVNAMIKALEYNNRAEGTGKPKIDLS